MTTKCRQPAQLCVLQSWLPGDPSVPLMQALDAGLHLYVQASLLYQCPPARCLLPPAMPLSPPKPLGQCCHLLALSASAALCCTARQWG